MLLPFDGERRVRALVERLGVSEAAARAFMALALHQDLDLGRAGEADLAAALSVLAGRPVGAPEARALNLSVFAAPNLALWALAARLKDRLIVGGFSDNPAFVAELFPDGARLEPMLWSSELGHAKASLEAFRAAQDRLGLPAEAILLIDDNPANVARAQSLGWDGIVFVANHQIAAALADRGLA